jgi:hypothetical protein
MKTEANVRIEALILQVKAEGMERTVLDACHDRHTCECLGIDYNSKNIYREVVGKLERYQRESKQD